MTQTFAGVLKGQTWECLCGVWWPRLLGAKATTVGTTCRVVSGICPNAQSIAHEFHHSLTTNDFRYLVSVTIGRLWGSTYWKDEERAANAYGLAMKDDPEFVAFAATIRAGLPASWPTVLIDHPV